MIARKDALDKITRYLREFVFEVEEYNAIGTYDVNIHAESTLIPILNAVFDLDLLNVNNDKRNFPAVDLIDDKNKVSFQITSTNTQDKVAGTIKKFVQHKLYEKYDTLFVYILTKKEERYNDGKLKELTEGQFDFDSSVHVIDFSDLLKRIQAIPSSERISQIARIFEHEFSAVQISARQKKFRDGFLKSSPEFLYVNLVKIQFGNTLFIADVTYDKKLATQLAQEQCRKNRLSYRLASNPEVQFKSILADNGIYKIDWVIREGKLITFRDLNDTKEPLSGFIDKGTIEAHTPNSYYEADDDRLNIFKTLLKNCLRHLSFTKNMEWVHDRKIIRFRNNEVMPRQMTTIWKGKKESTKTVIFEMMSKKKEGEEPHIICFRNMAFKPNFHLLGDDWYLSINPTWSFTDSKGQVASRFEPDYMSGLKRLESNNAVYYQFRFFSYFLSNTPPLFVEQYPYLKIVALPPLAFSPGIEDSKWVPPKEFVARNSHEAALFSDNELKAENF